MLTLLILACILRGMCGLSLGSSFECENLFAKGILLIAIQLIFLYTMFVSKQKSFFTRSCKLQMFSNFAIILAKLYYLHRNLRLLSVVLENVYIR